MILDAEISVFQFGPGLCFYPEFGVPVQSLEKEPGQTLVWSLGLEFGGRVWPNPGSAGSEFGESNGPTLVLQVRSLEKGMGRTLVWQVRRKDRAEPWFGRLGVRRKEWAKPWFGRFGVRRKNLAEL